MKEYHKYYALNAKTVFTSYHLNSVSCNGKEIFSSLHAFKVCHIKDDIYFIVFDSAIYSSSKKETFKFLGTEKTLQFSNTDSGENLFAEVFYLEYVEGDFSDYFGLKVRKKNSK